MTMDTERFAAALESRAQAVEAALRTLLSDHLLANEIARPPRLLAAMRHGVLNGGKRLRPFLVMEAAALFDADGPAARRVAAALECLHCYSLMHDDLPAMDDDDLRRGQPTVHRAFDEATAILAGDSLLTLAFDVICDPATELSAERRVRLAGNLARAAGIGGMAVLAGAEGQARPPDHRAARQRLGRRGHQRHPARRCRLRHQARLARAARGLDEERHEDRGAVGGDPAPQEED